jgi:tetratricopeptide (TPR) repeat protein
MNEANVRLQNLRDFTVQIRNAKDKIVGTGIAVSTDGKVVTCAHVVRAAGVNPRKANGAEIGVYFPQARGGEEKKRRATVAKFFPDHDDDFVLLQVTGGTSPLAPEQIAVLGDAGLSENHRFRSYGYRPLGTYPAGWADGTIMGCVECPADRTLQGEPVMLRSQHIAPGMSGSGVLDIKRNLLVGIVSETYFPRSDNPKDRDTAWATNARVLNLAPLGLTVQDAPLAFKDAPSPKYDIAQAEAAVFIKEKYSWNNAPAALPEWTGREELLEQITSDWMNPQKHVTGLIGFGGEGKSSLARKWVETLNVERSTFDGLFWWGFYENRSVDEFLEAALNYLSGGRIDPRAVPSSSTRAQIIGAMLGSGRYLFVLDGLEVMQHQEGDQYGLLQSSDLRDLLTFFARPDNASFCLVTSRAPLLDLMEYTTYTHRDVDRLLPADGRALLKRLGVHPSPTLGSPRGVLREGAGGEDDAALDKVVADWDGHALTLSLLGSYLSEHFGGDLAHLDDIPTPTADEPRYERVHRVLRRYDEHLTEAEREFLKLFSAFRTPVHQDAFEKVFVPLLANIGARHVVPLPEMVTRLVAYRILRHDAASQTYTAHPLVRNHYFALFTKGNVAQEIDAHSKIKDYYLSIAGDTPQYPTFDNLKPLIEVVHHACQAGAYEEAFNGVYWNRIQQGQKATLAHQLGDYDTDLNTLFEFFPNRDTSQEPQVKDSGDKRWILNEIGLCLMSLGRLRDAVPFYERSNKIALDMQDWHNASLTYQNLAQLYAHLGALEASAEAARQALDLARRAENKQDEMTSLSFQGKAAHLLGKIDEAKVAFQESEREEREVEPDKLYLYSYVGIQHADHLRRMGQSDYARRVTEANLQICEKNHVAQQISQCHRVLGDLDADVGNQESARAHYESALKIARSISKRDVLIEALLGRGRWVAKYHAVGVESPDPGRGDPAPTITDAFNDLNEALNYAVEGGYRRFEADIRVALAWAHLAVSSQPSAVSGQPSAISSQRSAKAEAERALQMSQEMGYHWGKVDAEEVLARILSL